MPFDWTCGALAAGLRCYRDEEFFEAHEHWEGVWLECDEPEKTFLQSIIQVAAAFHHLSRNNPTGAASLLRRSLRRLSTYPDAYAGIDVEGLRQSMRAWLHALEGGDREHPLPYPTIV